MNAKYATRASPPEEMVLLGKVVEVVVKKQDKTKQRESTPTKLTSNTVGRNALSEKKKSTLNYTENPQNWGIIFGNQNLLYMKQMQSPKPTTKHTENKEVKRNTNVHELQKNRCNKGSKHSDATSSKRISSQKKTEDCLKTCKKLSSSSLNSIESVLVQDRAVQVPEINNGAYRFGEFNPVRTLCFLIKELEESVTKDKKTNEIFNEIEQILCRIPVSSSPRKLMFGELDMISLQTKLEESKIKLQEYNKQMKAKRESWISEREILHSQIQKQDVCLKEADQKEAMFENHIKVLTRQLDEVTARATKCDDDTMLKQQIKEDERVISELRAELAKQTKLARDRHIKNQYMIIEKEKLSVLSSYKDTLIVELRNTIKELQNHNAEQLAALKEKCINDDEPGSPDSLVDTGPTCSSPNLSSANSHGLSNISLSIVKHRPEENVVPLKENLANKDSMHFVSLALGESSHTLLPESFQKQVANDEEMAAHQNKNDAVPHRSASADHEFARKSLHRSSREKHNEGNIPDRTIVSAIEKQYNILDDMQNVYRTPVDVPSPLRDCPLPDWSDSSLSSVNTATDVDIVPSNDI